MKPNLGTILKGLDNRGRWLALGVLIGFPGCEQELRDRIEHLNRQALLKKGQRRVIRKRIKEEGGGGESQ